MVRQMLEMMALAVEEGMVGGQRIDDLAHFRLVAADMVDIARKGLLPARPHQRSEPRIDEGRLAGWQDDAGNVVDNAAHRLEIGALNDLRADAGERSEAVCSRLRSCRRHHRAGLDEIIGHQRIDIKDQRDLAVFPRMVAPATPVTG